GGARSKAHHRALSARRYRPVPRSDAGGRHPPQPIRPTEIARERLAGIEADARALSAAQPAPLGIAGARLGLGGGRSWLRGGGGGRCRQLLLRVGYRVELSGKSVITSITNRVCCRLETAANRVPW